MGLNSKQKLIGQILGNHLLSCLPFWRLSRCIEFLRTRSTFRNHLWYFRSLLACWIFKCSKSDRWHRWISCWLRKYLFAAYGLIAWHQHQYDVLIICLSVLGGLLGFFVYNRKPAKIFMGDVGSLALGGLLAAISIMLNQEWTLLLIGLIYVMETASVMLQVTSFKLTGKRIFKMSPIHHHFEMCGWSEWKIDTVFGWSALWLRWSHYGSFGRRWREMKKYQHMKIRKCLS